MAASSLPNAAPTAKHLPWPEVLFGAITILHFFLTIQNWHSGFLAGHEFRQTQTALSIEFIARDHDYSLAYPTPLFGPPWSIPMEFPLYQWSVAALMQATHWPLPLAARTVTLGCFYLVLPALFWLLAELGIARRARWLVLSFTLAAPVYIFFSRAVLIESMALLCSVTFLAAFARMCRTGAWIWPLAAAAAGTAATLVKVTTFMPWCAGAAVLGLRWAWQTWHAQKDLRALGRTVLCGAICAVPPGIATFWWLHISDAIKSESPGGQALTSTALTDINFGTWHDRVSASSLDGMFRHADRAVGPWWLWLAALALAGVLSWRRQSIRPAVVPLLVFLGTLATFPVLYHRHDYYFYAIAILPAIALGVLLAPLIGAPRWRWLVPGITLALLAGQIRGYTQAYAPLHRIVSNGGTPLSHALHDYVPTDEALIIAGQDWASNLPYYSGRRALMLREDITPKPAAVKRYFDAMGDTPVAALVLTGPDRENHPLIEAAVTRFQLDPEVTLSDDNSDVYVSLRWRDNFLGRLIDSPSYAGVVPRGELSYLTEEDPEPLTHDEQIHPLTRKQARRLREVFPTLPYQYRCKFGMGYGRADGVATLGAHPDSDLWFKVPEHAHEVRLGFALDPGSYTDTDAPTDGVIFAVDAIADDGTETTLWTYHLNPVGTQSDRSPQTATVSLPAGCTTIRCSSRPGPSYDRDWAYWTGIAFN